MSGDPFADFDDPFNDFDDAAANHPAFLDFEPQGEQPGVWDSLLQSAGETGSDALRGLNQGLYMGGSDEVEALSPGRTLEQARKSNAQAEQRSPWAFTAAKTLGYVPGMFAAPASAVGRLALGVGQGALGGALSSDSDDPWETAHDALTGSLVSGGLGGAGEALGLAQQARPAIESAGKTLRRANIGGTMGELDTLRKTRGIDYMEQGVDEAAQRLGLFDSAIPQSAGGVSRKLDQSIIPQEGGRLGRSIDAAESSGAFGDWQNVENAIRGGAYEAVGRAPVPAAPTLAYADGLHGIADSLPRPQRTVTVGATSAAAAPPIDMPPPPMPAGPSSLRPTNAIVTNAPDDEALAALAAEAGPMGQTQARRWWTDEQAPHGPAEDPSIIAPPAPPASLGEIGWDPNAPRYRDPNIGPMAPAGPEMQASSRALATVPRSPAEPPTYGPFETLTTPPPQSNSLASYGDDAMASFQPPPPAAEPVFPAATTPRRFVGPRELQAQKVEFEGAGAYPEGTLTMPADNVRADAYRQAAGAVRGELDDTMRQASPDTYAQFSDARGNYQDAQGLSAMAGKRAASNRAGLGLTNPGTLGAMGVGFGAGAAPGALMSDPLSAIAGGVGGAMTGYAGNVLGRNYGQDALGIAIGRGAAPAASALGGAGKATSLGAGAIGTEASEENSGTPGGSRGYMLPQAALELMRQPGALGKWEKEFFDAANSNDTHALSQLIVRLSHTDDEFAQTILPQLKQLTATEF